jgi:hypothetical protein
LNTGKKDCATDSDIMKIVTYEDFLLL